MSARFKSLVWILTLTLGQVLSMMGEVLSKVKSDTFNRLRCDPPYNEETAKNMDGTKLPNTYRLLGAGARVCKSKSLCFYYWAHRIIRYVLQA